MNFNNENNRVMNNSYSYSKNVSTTFMANVFSWMFAALSLTALAAYSFGNNPNLIRLMFDESGMTTLAWIVMFAPLGFVWFMSARFASMSQTTLTAMFFIYSALVGMSMSFIFLAYTSSSIVSTFFITAGMYGAMALIGYTTKRDLTKMGSILMMAVIGIIIASVVNIFMGSSLLNTIISIVGVIIFSGLTAYDVQRLKEMSYNLEEGSEMTTKVSIMGALSLYLNFINMFMFLLRLFGSKDE